MRLLHTCHDVRRGRHRATMTADGLAQRLCIRAPKSALDQRRLQIQPKQLERHRCIDRHQRIAMRVQASIAVLKDEKSRLAHLEIPKFPRPLRAKR